MENEQIALDKLPGLRQNLLNEIELALKEGGRSSFFEAIERLRSGDALLDQVVSLWQRKEASLLPKNAESIAEPASNFHESPQQNGETVKSTWVYKTFGKAVRHDRRSLYRNGRDEIIGIAYGQEFENRKNRWFLGLPEKEVQSAILLCESLDGKLDAICLPLEFIAKYGQKFSRANGQVKFNVSRKGGKWFLKVPGIDHIEITGNVNKISLVI